MSLSLPGLADVAPGTPLPPQTAAAVLVQAGRRCAFFVPGEPKPMGSKSAFLVKGRPIVTDGKAGKGIKGWKDSVIGAAMYHWGDGPRITGPAIVSLTFCLARPGGHYGKDGKPRRSAPAFPAVKPDLDKLARSTLDALAVVMLADDSRVVSMALVKRYADSGPTGAYIVVEEM